MKPPFFFEPLEGHRVAHRGFTDLNAMAKKPIQAKVSDFAARTLRGTEVPLARQA